MSEEKDKDLKTVVPLALGISALIVVGWLAFWGLIIWGIFRIIMKFT